MVPSSPRTSPDVLTDPGVRRDVGRVAMGEDALVGPALGHLGESVVPFLYNDDDQIDLIWLDVILFLSQLDRQHFLRMTEKAHLYKM